LSIQNYYLIKFSFPQPQTGYDIYVLLEYLNMFKKISRRNKLIFSIIILTILLSGGFFLWENKEIKGSPDDYIIKENAHGNFVYNKKAGLTVKIPEDWMIKKMGINDGLEEGAIVLSSPNTEKELQKALPLEKGCLVFLKTLYEKIDLAEIKMEAMYTHSTWILESQEFEETTINSYQALKSTFNTLATGPGMGFYIPQNNKVYWINLFWAVNQKEECVQIFDNFLKTISIK